MTYATLAAGTDFAGRYQVERELGRGGMAAVFLAEERKHSRQVALKVLRPELTATVGADRFLREIGIAARLAHPHIVPLIDSGEENGYLYYVSPYVAGGSLRERLQHDGKLGVDEALRIAHEVALGLDYAHRNGFVHRDVKPENILFVDGHALLSDFGVARACGGTPAPAPLTEGGLALGTPAYMSPEQAAGETDISSASDVYSLACVVFEMLAGSPPFDGDNARAIMAKQVTGRPPSLRALRPEVPLAVEQALARALAKDPADRFQSTTAFVAALESVPLPTAPAARTIAVLPFANSSGDPANDYLSDGITEDLIDALAKVEGLRVTPRVSAFALRGRAQDVRAIGALLGASVVLEGTVRRAGDRIRVSVQLSSAEDGNLLWSNRYDRELSDVFALQDELATTIVATLRATFFAELTDPVARRSTENVRAYSLYLRGRHAWNLRNAGGIADAIRYFEQAIVEDADFALAYTGLADCYAMQADYRDTPVGAGLERAAAYARRALELDDSLAEAHASLAWTLFIHAWRWDEADAEFRRAIELDRRYAEAHQWYSFLLAARGRFADALVESYIAIEINRASASARRSLGWVHMYARRYADACDHIGVAVNMDPTSEESRRLQGLVLSLDGRHAEAEKVLRHATTIPGSGSYTEATLGYAIGRSGRRAEAGEILDRLLERRRREYVTPVAISMLHIALGDREAALTLAEEAFEERRGWLAYFPVSPVVDPLRGHPRFDRLVERLGL